MSRIPSLPARGAWLWLGLALPVLAGCDRSFGAGTTYTVRDSAGIRIVESTGPSWEPVEAWTVSEVPMAHIGVVEGEPPYQFSFIAGVFRASDGGFVVGDGRTGEVRFFGPDGTFRGSVGRVGEGPGEFRGAMSRLEPYPGDSIAVVDRTSRVTLFDRAGRMGRALRIRPPPPPEPTGEDPYLYSSGGIVAVLADGSFLVTGGSRIEGSPGERILSEWVLLRYAAEGDSLRSYGLFPGTEMTVPDFTARNRMPPTPFARRMVTTSAGDRLYFGRGEGMEVEVRSLDGALETLIRASHRDLALKREQREMYRELWRRSQSEVGRDPRDVERLLADAEFPDRIPPYSDLLVDSEGYLWMAHYRARGTPRPQSWSVFAPGGWLLGTVETPEHLEIREIGPDYVLGIWTDELDVRYVRMYALNRG